MDFQESKEPPMEVDNRKYLTLTLSVFFALLSFFILLNVIAESNTKKSGNLKRSINNEFNNKELKKELSMFNKREYDTGIGDYKKTFKDVVTAFLDSVKGTINAELAETPEEYIIKVKTISLFGPNDNNHRATAINFLQYMNKFISVIKKEQPVNAIMVMLYDSNDPTAQKNTQEKIQSLSTILDDEAKVYVRFSLAPLEVRSATDREKLTNIYMLFSKNEF